MPKCPCLDQVAMANQAYFADDDRFLEELKRLEGKVISLGLGQVVDLLAISNLLQEHLNTRQMGVWSDAEDGHVVLHRKQAL